MLMSGSLPFLLILIPSLPLAAAIITAVFGRSMLKENSHRPVIVALVGSFLASLMLLSQVHTQSEASEGVGWEATIDLWNWVRIDNALSTPAAAQPVPEQGLAALPPVLPFTIGVTLRADAL